MANIIKADNVTATNLAVGDGAKATSIHLEGGESKDRAVAPVIFISYRREDEADMTGRIYDRIVRDFSERNVFRDRETIPAGVDFVDTIESAIAACDAFVVVIGPRWLARGADGVRRIDREHDFVRLEVRAALDRKIPVVPVLIGGATMPVAEHLPADIRALARRNARAVRSDPDFRGDMANLIADLREAGIPKARGPARGPDGPSGSLPRRNEDEPG